MTITDWIFLMLGIAVALVSAMGVLYVGKAFGTPLDYLTAFLWGIGVDQALKGLGGVLSKLGIPSALGAAGAPPKAG